MSGLHSARSSYLAVSSSLSTWPSTKISRQNALPAPHIPQMKVILQTSGWCLGRAQGHLDSLPEKMLPWKVAPDVKSRTSCCPAPTFLGSEDAAVCLRQSAPGDGRGPSRHRPGDAASSCATCGAYLPPSTRAPTSARGTQQAPAEFGGTQIQFQEVLWYNVHVCCAHTRGHVFTCVYTHRWDS